LNWNASTDSGGGTVAGYKIYRDGNATEIATVTGTSYVDIGLSENTLYSYTVSAFDNAASSNESLESDSDVATTWVGSLISYRINAGGVAEYTDSAGNVWSADTGFNTGAIGTPYKYIAGTNDQALFHRNRYDVDPMPELMYQFNVPNGNYMVKLYFAETYSPLYANGSRVFDVAIEGNIVWSNLDVFAQAGGAEKMLMKSTEVLVGDGELNIEFRHGLADHPMISAIEIMANSNDTQPPSVPTGLTATATNAGQIELNWIPSTDSGGGTVAGYKIYRDGNATEIATVTGTSYVDTGLSENTLYSYTVSAFDNAASSNESLESDSDVATTWVGSLISYRINAGGVAEYTDSAGNVWSADTGFNTGAIGTPYKYIAGTNDQALFHRNRYDVDPMPELMYQFNVPNGNYMVKLYFAETYSPLYANGSRVFDVAIEGNIVWSNLDVFAQAGGAEKMLMKSTEVLVGDGELNIEFRHGLADHPMISAIEIIGTQYN